MQNCSPHSVRTGNEDGLSHCNRCSTRNGDRLPPTDLQQAQEMEQRQLAQAELRRSYDLMLGMVLFSLFFFFMLVAVIAMSESVNDASGLVLRAHLLFFVGSTIAIYSNEKAKAVFDVNRCRYNTRQLMPDFYPKQKARVFAVVLYYTAFVLANFLFSSINAQCRLQSYRYHIGFFQWIGIICVSLAHAGSLFLYYMERCVNK
jgi:hypothetical protein